MKVSMATDGTWHAVIRYNGRTLMGYGATRLEARDFALDLLSYALKLDA
jgi:hypothetical protein